MQMKRPLSACIFFLMSLSGFAQAPSTKEIVPASPEAAALAKFINFPIDLSTGTISMGIDLFQAKSGDLSLPVSISCHTGGVRAGERSTSVGLSWKLNGIPLVSRTIKNIPDEQGYLVNPNVAEFNDQGAPPSKSVKIAMADGVQNAEQEPDEFYYSLSSGRSGKFYFQKYKDGNGVMQFKAVPVPYEPILIQFNKAALTFEITDIDGTVYNFNGAKELTKVDYDATHWRVTSWKCTSITSASGNSITFGYSSLPDVTKMVFNDRIVITDVGGFPLQDPNELPTSSIEEYYNYAGSASPFEYKVQFPDCNCPPVTIPSTIQNNYTTTTTNDMQVASISYRGGSAVFHYNGNSLQGIEVKNLAGQVVKSIVFTQHSLEANTSGACGYGTDRYILDAVTIAGQGAAERYSFDYYMPPSYIIVPKNPSSADPWGYVDISSSCAFDNSSPAIPRQEIDVSGNGCYDCPTGKMTIGSLALGSGMSLERTRFYSLKAFHYPTGGKAEITYEQNQHKVVKYNGTELVTTIEPAGGLRVASVKYYDAASSTPKLEKNYKYGIDEDGVGILKTPLNVNQYSYEQTVDAKNSTQPARRRTFVSQALADLFYSNGAPVVYDVAVEYQNDGMVTGVTKYEYNYPRTARLSSEKEGTTNIFYKPYGDWKYGKLLRKTQYETLGGSRYENVVQSTEYYYEDFVLPQRVHRGQVFRRVLLPGWEGQDKFDREDIFYASEPITIGNTLLSKIVEYNGTTKTIQYFRDNPAHLQVTREQTADVYDRTITTYTSYPHDYAAGTAFIDNLKNKNILVAPIEKVTKVDSKIISGKILTYKTEGNGLIDEEYAWETASAPASAFKFSSRAAAGTIPAAGTASVFSKDPAYKRKATFSYGDFGTPVMIQPTDNNAVSFAWGYNNTLPIVKAENIDNATLATYVTQSLPAGFATLDALLNTITTLPNTNWNTFNSNLRSKSASIRITTYTYNPLVGTTSTTDANGVTTYFEYDSVGRHKQVRDDKGNIVKHYEYNYQIR
jgi:YD repeat-containing protein